MSYDVPAVSFGSLFSGIGGFDLGFERAGMRALWQIEIDPQCQAVLKTRWPDVERYDDVTTATGLATVDVLCGGFPCQDLSVAGRRAGLAGERSGLFYAFMDRTAEILPAWVVIENVPGLLSSNRGRDMAAVLGTLEKLGYGWAYRVLDAQYFGVAQRRRRVFIVGHHRTECAAKVLFEPESCNRYSPPSRKAGQVPAFTLAASVRGTGGGHGNAWNSNCVTAFHMTQDPIPNEVVSPALGLTSCGMGIAHTLRAEGHDESEDGTGRGVPLVVDTTQITSRANYSNPRPGDDRHPLASGARPPLMVQPTVRRLTPRECERLQGFSDDWTLVPQWNGKMMSDSSRYRMLGNAVAVPVAEWIGRRIVARERSTD